MGAKVGIWESRMNTAKKWKDTVSLRLRFMFTLSHLADPFIPCDCREFWRHVVVVELPYLSALVCVTVSTRSLCLNLAHLLYLTNQTIYHSKPSMVIKPRL